MHRSLLAVAVGALAVCSAPAAALDVTFSNMCDNFSLHQSASSVEIVCPGEREPRLTIQGCVQATARRNKATGVIALSCGAGSTFVVGLR